MQLQQIMDFCTTDDDFFSFLSEILKTTICQRYHGERFEIQTCPICKFLSALKENWPFSTHGPVVRGH